MKYSILNLLLGASLIIAAPIAMADNNWKEHKHKQQKHVKKHIKKQNKHFVAKQAIKSHNNRKSLQKHNKHSKYNNHNNSWSVTTYGWNDNSQGYRDNDRRYSVSIRERQNKQSRKIRKGIQKGQLVRKEVRRLRGEQRRIADRIRNYRHDGHLNRHERRKIHRMLDVSAKNIRNKRQNRLTKYSQNRHDRNHNRYDFVFNW